MRLDTIIPNFKAETTFGPIDFYNFQGDSWVVLFSHPADFTPVCTTELGRMAVHDHEFKKRNVKLLALSCDKMQSHIDWVNDIKSYCPDIKTDFPYPIIGDETRELAVLLDMISENDKNNPELAMTVRALYIISPDHKLKLAMVYPTSTGRNVDEILRCIDSLQLCARVKCVATPANWTPGTKVMILPHVKDEDLPKLFPKGVEKVSLPSGVNYAEKLRGRKKVSKTLLHGFESCPLLKDLPATDLLEDFSSRKGNSSVRAKFSCKLGGEIEAMAIGKYIIYEIIKDLG